MTCVTSLRVTTIPSHGIQTLSRSPEVNGGWERNRGPEENRGPERNRGPEGNCERGRIDAEHLGLQLPECPASIPPRQYFVDQWLFLFFFFNSPT